MLRTGIHWGREYKAINTVRGIIHRGVVQRRREENSTSGVGLVREGDLLLQLGREVGIGARWLTFRRNYSWEGRYIGDGAIFRRLVHRSLDYSVGDDGEESAKEGGVE